MLGPRGEGWGEGERGARISQRDRLALTIHSPPEGLIGFEPFINSNLPFGGGL